MLLLINEHDRDKIAEKLRGIAVMADNCENWDDISQDANDLADEIEELGCDIEREYDENFRFAVEGNTVKVVAYGKTVFEYVHPDPWGLLATIRILEDRGIDDNCEVLVEWGHGSGWCNKDTMFTRLTHRSLLPEIAS
jgi:hypothetical protein